MSVPINVLKSVVFSYLSRWLVTVVLSIVAIPIYADQNAVMSECRNLAFDQSGFIECIDLLQQDTEQSLASVESDWIAHLRNTQADALNAEDEINQLLASGVTYREYRDQHCGFKTLGLDSVSMATTAGACRVAMDRVRLTELRRLLIEHRARLGTGNFYRGFYLQTQDSGIFQSCDLRQDWTVNASADVDARLTERYQALTTETLEIVYIEFRGVAAGTETPDTIGEVTVNSVSLIRPLLDSDCEHTQVTQQTADNEVEEEQDVDIGTAVDSSAEGLTNSPGAAVTTDSTIDDLGDAGYVYGYFGAWTSLCAADAPQVCKAQTTDVFSSEGDWQMVVDRSADRNWRVRIAPTTDSHVIGSQVQVTIDGVALLTAPVSSSQVLIGDTITLATGERALQLLNSMRNGVSFELNWNSQNQTNANLMFSLVGVSLALQYFDERGN